MKAIINGQLFTPQAVADNGVVLIDGETIAAVGPAHMIEIPSDAQVVDAGGRRIVPGLIDIHMHGLLGHSCMGQGVAEVAASLPRYGVTAFCPTTITAPMDRVFQALKEIAAVIDARPRGARILGIHIEGPHLSPKRPGMAPADIQHPLTWEEYQRMQEAAQGHIKMITFAPEEGDAAALIPRLLEQHVLPVLGHTDASFEQVSEWVKIGLSHVTHAFNAMRGFHHRRPGALGAVLLHDELVTQLIADGHHIHPGAMALLWKLKGPTRMVLISDAIPYAGMPSGEYDWEGYHLFLDGDTSRLEDGTLAGAIALLNQDVITLVERVRIPFPDALTAATTTPAQLIGHGDRLGRLAPGYAADIAILEEDGSAWQTWVNGEIVFAADA
ncbi:MAG: N-acetylglucosamine-6-phosphate deacetylase [Anaerolineae bacterium]|nr:N-acetylglucosamine-6-phosphate deacetylase [Anaerolineae bacterium]